MYTIRIFFFLYNKIIKAILSNRVGRKYVLPKTQSNHPTLLPLNLDPVAAFYRYAWAQLHPQRLSRVRSIILQNIKMFNLFE